MKTFYSTLFALFIVVQLSAQEFTDSNLPIVIITTDIDPETGEPTEIVDEPKIVASMKIIYRTDGSRNYVTDQDNEELLDYNGRIGIEFRGSTSQNLPKKPYGLETREADDDSSNNVEILGMPSENDWVLNSLAYDPSLIRDYLTYDLARAMGNYASRGVYCEVIVNGDYKGLYIFMEKLKRDSDRIDVSDIESQDISLPEVTGGYITKCDKVDPDETIAWTYPSAIGWYANFLHELPEQDVVTTEQTNYIKSVFDELRTSAAAQNSSIINGFPSVIDIPSFVDFMISNELASNVDAYQFSTYFHKDRGGKLRAGPVWDFNFSYGNDSGGIVGRSEPDVWQFDNGDNVGPFFWKELFDNPEFNCYLSKRWQELTAPGELLDYAVLEAKIDALDLFLAEARVREQNRWNALTGHNEVVFKTWFQDRYTFLNTHLTVNSNCSFPDTPELVISKIHYNPIEAGGFEDDDLEYIGITNNSTETIDLTGIYLRALGISYQFPEGATIDSGDVFYIVNNTEAFELFYGVPALGEYMRNLSNGSQRILLSDAFGNTIDDVTYDDENPWPEEADGDGPHLELNDLNSDNNLGINWIAVGGTLGLNSITDTSTTKIFPNPSKGLVYIKNETMPIKKVEAYDLMGRLVFDSNVRSNELQIDLSRYQNSVYILKLTLENDSTVLKKINIY